MLRRIVPLAFLSDLGLILAVLLTRFMTTSVYLHKWDSVQFALALSDYDITRQQPHPPGYPGYIGLAWLFRRFVPDDNASLVMVGVISAMVLVVALHRMGRAILGPRAGFFAGVLAAFNPLVWYFSDIALAYLCGVTVATLAVWAAFSAKGRAKAWIPVLMGLSAVFWHPMTAILVLPVCLWGFLREDSREEAPDRAPRHPTGSLVVEFLALAAIPILAGYLPVILRTGGLGPYLATIGSESGKHIIQVSQWLRAPLDEFAKNTQSLAGLFEEGLGMGRWLLLMLLIPMPGEIGARPSRVIGLLPLAIAGFVCLHWGTNAALRTAGIVAATVAFAYLFPRPASDQTHARNRLFVWWLLPGLLFFIPVYANYIGILLIFLPGLILLEAASIERAAIFMALQTVRDPQPAGKDGSGQDSPGRGPDIRVERLVAWVLVFLMAMYGVQVFTKGNSTSQESLNGIIARDFFIQSVISVVRESPVPERELLLLGGEDDYRHWTYYLPEARIIWTKYLLYRDIRPGVKVWVSHERHQDPVIPDVAPGQAEGSMVASFPLEGERAIFVLPEEMEKFVGTATVVPLGPEDASEGGSAEPVGFLVNVGNATRIVFGGGTWTLQ